MFNLEQHEFMQRIESLFSSDNWEDVYAYISENIKALDELKLFYNFCYEYRQQVSNVNINYDLINKNLRIDYSHTPDLPARSIVINTKLTQLYGKEE